MKPTDREAFFKYLWRIGDPLPIAESLNLKYVPPDAPADIDLDDELRLMVEHARNWIADVYVRLYRPAPA
jgi:hypothetical protein